MNSKTMAMASLIITTLAIGGCTNYYAIDDPSTGRTYYTTHIHAQEGALAFEDEATGRMVNIQNAEVTEITKDQFRQQTGGK